MLTHILGGCGTGKSVMLMQLLRANLETGQQVLVLVPEQFSFEAEKKLYDFLGAKLFNQIRTYSFATLSRDILQAAAARNTGYASEQEKLLYLYQAIQHCVVQKELTFLERRASAPDFIMNLYGLITKIRKASVSAEMLETASLTFQDALGHKAGDIGRILLTYDRILQEHGRVDSLVDLTEAAGIADMQYFFEGMHVFIDEFDSFTGDQYKMLEVILKQATDVTAAVRADDPNQRPTGMFLGGNNTFYQLRRMAKDLSLQEEIRYQSEYRRSVYSDLAAVSDLQHEPGSALYEGHVHIFEASEPVMEVEYICAEICRLLQEQPELKCSDIAIAVKSPAVYFPLLERALNRYALPYDLSTAKPVLYTDLVRHFQAVLSLLASNELKTDHILRYLKTPLSGYDAEDVAMMEHFCFTWGIDKDDWKSPFWEENNETLTRRSSTFGGERLEVLRAAFLKELTSLKRKCRNASVRDVCMVLYKHLCEKKDGSHILAAAESNAQKEFVMLWNLLMDILDTLTDCFGEQVLPLDVLQQSVLLLLQTSSFSTPPQTLDSIRIVNAQTARLNAPAIVFVPGVRESVFPGEVKLTGMFTQQELQQLEAQDIRLSRLLPELHSDELLIVNKTLAAPSEHLYLTYPLMTETHEPATAASILLQIERLFKNADGLLQKEQELPLHFYVRTLAAGYFHYVRNLCRNTSELSALRVLLEQDAVYAARLKKLVIVQDLSEVSVTPDNMNHLLGEKMVLSPSGIEQFYNCAFRYFCQDALRLYVPERNAFDHRTGGSFAHFCLEQLLLTMGTEGFLELTHEDLCREIERISGDFSVRNFSESVRRDSRFQFNYRKAGQSLVQLAERMQNTLRQTGFVPVGFEVKVTEQPGENHLPPMQLQNGNIICHGNIDRVDLCSTPDGGLLRVVDYKTGTKALIPEKLADGLDMQMLIYLFALQQNGAYKHARPSGVFYMPSGQPKRTVFETRDKATGRDAVLDRFYQMKGLLLDSTAPFMESELQNTAAPVLGHGDKDTLFSVNAVQLAHLQQYVEKKICDMADRLRAGQIAPVPNLYQEYSPCKSCTFADICGKADQSLKKRTDEEKQQALTEVFGSEADDENNGQDEKEA